MEMGIKKTGLVREGGFNLRFQPGQLGRVLNCSLRRHALPAVLDGYLALKAEYDKETTVDVVSATVLSPAQQDKLIAALSQRLARKVKLNCSVDPTVVGGMLIKAGDLVIDGSVRGKLDRLATALQS